MIALWIAYAVLISVLLSGVAFGLESALRLYGRSVRWVWAIVIAGGLVTPVAVLLMGLLPARPESSGIVPDVPSAGLILLDPLMMAFAPPASLLERLGTPLIGVWVLMTVALVVFVMGGALRLARKRSGWKSRPVAGDRALISENFGPAVVGIRHTEIVLPEWALGLEPKELHLIMLHEREHQKARDTQLLSAGLFAVLLMPWNVALWWQLRRLRGAVELDCDARVLRTGVSGTEYGTLLLRMGERISGMGIMAAAMAEPRSLLEGRIRMIIEKKPKARVVRAAVALGLAGTVLAAACEMPLPSLVKEQLDEAAIEQVESVGTVSIREQAQGTEPLIVINGEILERPSLSDLKPVAIERIEVIKGGAAIELYGEQAANGVVIITLKEGVETTVAEEDLVETVVGAVEKVAADPTFTPFTVRPEIKNRTEVIKAMEEAYPQDLRDAGIGGRVVMWFYITETGEVSATRISQTSGHRGLDAAALSVASVYEFTRPMNEDTPVSVWVQFPITFQVN